MDYKHLFAERARRMKASEIREILAVTQRMEIVSFAGGLPNPATFPKKEILDATRTTLDKYAHLALQYSPTMGIPELQEEVVKYLKRDGINYTAKNLMITSGSQQGLDLLGRIFLEPGAKVLVGSPTYLGAIQAFENYLIREQDFVPVKSDDEGMDPESVDETLTRLERAGQKARVIYTCPTFQNPAGTVMPANRRRRLLEVAHAHDVVVIEDDPYGKLRYEGDPVPSMASMDKEARVIYLGTFSKILVPGFRLAWIGAHETLMRQFEVGKQAMDLCTSAFTQFVTAEIMRSGFLDRHLPDVIKLYRTKRDIMMKSLQEQLPQGSTWTKSHGGLFTFVRLAKGIDTSKMLKRAIQNHVAYVPGNSFYVDGSGANTMRINFSHPADDMIPVGVERLARTIREETQTVVA